MSDNIPAKPILRELLDELHTVVEWKILAVYFGLEEHDIATIQERHPRNPQHCKIDVFSRWLRRDLNASWEKVAKALEFISERVLANNIRQRYIKQQRDPVTKETASTTQKEKFIILKDTDKMAVTFQGLEGEFAALVTDVQDLLTTNNIAMTRLRTFCKQLIPDCAINEDNCTSTEQLFDHLRPQCTCLN